MTRSQIRQLLYFTINSFFLIYTYLTNSNVYHKVKCTLVQALRLCTGRTAHRGSRDIALLFHDHGTKRGEGVSVTPRPLFTPGKDLVPIVQEAGWAPGTVWPGAENLAPPEFDPRTVQPVASRYADYAIRPTDVYHNNWIMPAHLHKGRQNGFFYLVCLGNFPGTK